MTKGINEILATLNAEGSSRASRGTSTAHNVLVADENGRLDASWLEGLDIVGTPLAQSWYVDDTNGDDTYVGGATSPLKTLQEALDRSTTPGTVYTIYLAPGTYGNVTSSTASIVSLVAAPGNSKIQNAAGPGYQAYRPVTVNVFTFDNGAAANAISVSGNISVTTVSNVVGGSYLTVLASNGSAVGNADSLLAGSAFVFPGSTIGTLLGLTKYLVAKASEISYTIDDPGMWPGSTPVTAADGMDILADRTKVIEDAYLDKNNNLSDVVDADTSLTNIGGAKTGANVGTTGLEVFKQKNGLNLEFRKLNPLSAKMVINNTAEPDRIDFDVNVTKADIGLGNVQNILSNFTATTDPGPTNDSGEGYSSGSWWINTVAETVWSCIDASPGAAVWEPQGAGALASTIYAASFTAGHIFANILTVDHNLGERVVEVVVASDTFNKVYNLPVNYVNDNRLTIDFTGVPVTNTWYLRVYKSGGEGGGIYGDAGTGLAVYDRVSYMYTITPTDISNGYFVLPGVVFKYKDKVAIYIDGVRQVNSLITGVLNPDFQPDPAVAGRINIRDAATTPSITLTGDILQDDVLEVIFDI